MTTRDTTSIFVIASSNSPGLEPVIIERWQLEDESAKHYVYVEICPVPDDPAVKACLLHAWRVAKEAQDRVEELEEEVRDLRYDLDH